MTREKQLERENNSNGKTTRNTWDNATNRNTDLKHTLGTAPPTGESASNMVNVLDPAVGTASPTGDSASNMVNVLDPTLGTAPPTGNNASNVVSVLDPTLGTAPPTDLEMRHEHSCGFERQPPSPTLWPASLLRFIRSKRLAATTSERNHVGNLGWPLNNNLGRSIPMNRFQCIRAGPRASSNKSIHPSIHPYIHPSIRAIRS